MVKLHFGQFLWFVAAIVLFLGGCGGHKPAGASPFPAKITLSPPTSASLQQGGILVFTASAQNAVGSSVRPGFAFASDNPDVLTMSPTGLACAGTWNAPLYTICAPAGIGVANVTASALGATSPPTLVFVHAAIDNIQITVVPPVNSPPPACPTQVALPEACSIQFTPTSKCLSQNQVQNLQANAFSQGTDITPSVGPFTWSEATNSVVTVTPTVNLSTSIATNQASATPNTPGQTQVFATASGVSSQAYEFETCPVQCIALEVGTSDSQQAGQTSFIVNKGTSETITATAVDVQGCAVPKPPLTWTSSQPASIVAGSAAVGCAAGTTCVAITPAVGAAAITASCTPPTCNVGFPLNPSGFPAGSVFIPQPVYPVTAISGLVNPATSSTPTASTFNVLATSLDCTSNAFCTVALYNIPTSKNVAGNAVQLPAPPNSLIFDPAGDKAYMGSQYGATLFSPANLGTGTSAFSTLSAAATPTGKVTGKALATSPNGSVAIFSDTVSTPNQVYVVNTAASVAVATTTLNISGATTAAFSRDGMKAFIIGCITGPVPCTATSGNTLYVYSALQSLQSIPLSFAANAVVFSSSGTFALISGGSSTAASAITVNTCDNSSNSLPMSSLPGPPTFLKMVPAGNAQLTQIPSLNPVGLDFFFGLDSTGVDIIATNASQPPLQQPLAALCPQTVGLAQLNSTAQVFTPIHISLGQGSFNPINFFLSPDNAQVYVVASNLSRVLVYNFNTATVSAIPLANSITGQTVLPVSADITPDGTLIYVGTSDGTLHEISTASGDSSDLTQIPFPPIPNATNGFCVNADSPVNCTLNLVVMRP